jgi:hypothetical protein
MRKILLTSMKEMNLSYREFFQEVLLLAESKKKFWTINELNFLNNQLKIEFDKNDINNILEMWDKGRNRSLSIEELAESLGIELDHIP